MRRKTDTATRPEVDMVVGLFNGLESTAILPMSNKIWRNGPIDAQSLLSFRTEQAGKVPTMLQAKKFLMTTCK